MARKPALFLCVLAFVTLTAATPFQTQPEGYKLVVHASNPVSLLARPQASDLFLKRATRWPSGRPVVPVDLTERNPARQAFSREIHGRSTAAIKSYWQQMIFSGRGVPPVERGTDAEVLAFVRDHPDAIGYVSASVSVGSAVKVIRVR